MKNATITVVTNYKKELKSQKNNKALALAICIIIYLKNINLYKLILFLLLNHLDMNHQFFVLFHYLY